jgi:hypothetical protein
MNLSNLAEQAVEQERKDTIAQQMKVFDERCTEVQKALARMLHLGGVDVGWSQIEVYTYLTYAQLWMTPAKPFGLDGNVASFSVPGDEAELRFVAFERDPATGDTHRKYDFGLVWQCDECNRIVVSDRFRTMADLGRTIECGMPDHCCALPKE